MRSDQGFARPARADLQLRCLRLHARPGRERRDQSPPYRVANDGATGGSPGSHACGEEGSDVRFDERETSLAEAGSVRTVVCPTGNAEASGNAAGAASVGSNDPTGQSYPRVLLVDVSV